MGFKEGGWRRGGGRGDWCQLGSLCRLCNQDLHYVKVSADISPWHMLVPGLSMSAASDVTNLYS